jgi:hypothetical protein
VTSKEKAESATLAVTGQEISKNYLKNKILKVEIDSKFRLCNQYEETINRLMSGCPIWRKIIT